MDELQIIEWVGGIGGVGAIFGMVMFFMYRIDRKCSEENLAKMSEAHEERLTELLRADQETRRRNTEVLMELATLIKTMNGRTPH